MLKRIVLFGWVLVITGGILIVEFPNAGWNHAASEIVWVLSIGVFFATFFFVVMTAARLIAKLITKLTRPRTELPTTIKQIAAQPTPKPRWRLRLLLASAAVIGIAAFMAALLTFIEHEIKLSSVYQVSLARAQESADVARIVGLPVKPGWLVTGEITESTDGTGSATLSIPLDGPRGHGTLHVQAQRRGGKWRPYVLQFVSADKTSAVNLLGQPSTEHPATR